jgi:hypothetical protein
MQNRIEPCGNQKRSRWFCHQHFNLVTNPKERTADDCNKKRSRWFCHQYFNLVTNPKERTADDCTSQSLTIPEDVLLCLNSFERSHFVALQRAL